jgi:hypothetical protein
MKILQRRKKLIVEYNVTSFTFLRKNSRVCPQVSFKSATHKATQLVNINLIDNGMVVAKRLWVKGALLSFGGRQVIGRERHVTITWRLLGDNNVPFTHNHLVATMQLIAHAHSSTLTWG